MSKVVIKCSKSQFNRIMEAMTSYTSLDSHGFTQCILGRNPFTCPAMLGPKDLSCTACLKQSVTRAEKTYVYALISHVQGERNIVAIYENRNKAKLEKAKLEKSDAEDIAEFDCDAAVYTIVPYEVK